VDKRKSQVDRGDFLRSNGFPTGTSLSPQISPLQVVRAVELNEDQILRSCPSLLILGSHETKHRSGTSKEACQARRHSGYVGRRRGPSGLLANSRGENLFVGGTA
jgi:hypothetical protein